MRQKGFTYIGLLLLLAMMGTALAGAGTLWSIESRREKERDLLFAGEQFRSAIAAYRDRTPAGQAPRFPRRLEDLLKDERWPTTRRHLRQIYVDPMTGKREWGLERSPAGEILGVHSLSMQQPLKQAGFPPHQEQFAGATTYRDWNFIYTAPGAATN